MGASLSSWTQTVLTDRLARNNKKHDSVLKIVTNGKFTSTTMWSKVYFYFRCAWIPRVGFPIPRRRFHIWWNDRWEESLKKNILTNFGGPSDHLPVRGSLTLTVIYLFRKCPLDGANESISLSSATTLCALPSLGLFNITLWTLCKWCCAAPSGVGAPLYERKLAECLNSLPKMFACVLWTYQNMKVHRALCTNALEWFGRAHNFGKYLHSSN